MSTYALHGRCPYCEFSFAIAARARGETLMVHCGDCREPFVVTIAVRVEIAAVHGLAGVDQEAVLKRLEQREIAAGETADGAPPDNTTPGQKVPGGSDAANDAADEPSRAPSPTESIASAASAAEGPGTAPSQEGAGSATGAAALSAMKRPEPLAKTPHSHPALRDPPRRAERLQPKRREPLALKVREVNGDYGSRG